PGPNQHLSQSQKFKTKKLTARSNRPSSREAAYKPHYAKWSIGNFAAFAFFRQCAEFIVENSFPGQVSFSFKPVPVRPFREKSSISGASLEFSTHPASSFYQSGAKVFL
ncbi:hypothetical protein, partial [Rhizobium paknamense]